MRKHAALVGVAALFAIICVKSALAGDGSPPVVMSWSAAVTETGNPSESYTGTSSGGALAQTGPGFGIVQSAISANTDPRVSPYQVVGDPNVYTAYELDIQTSIESNLGTNIGTVSGSITFSLSQPTLAYLNGVYTGTYHAGYTFNGPLTWSTSEVFPGNPASFTLLGPGTYTMSVSDTNIHAGESYYGNNDANIYFLITPEPGAVLLALPLLWLTRRTSQRHIPKGIGA